MHARGKIIAYSKDVSAGVIQTATGQTFMFTRSAWTDPSPPTVDIEVRFVADGKNALDVRPY